MYSNTNSMDVNSYWNLLKDLSENVKLQLISRLSSSLLEVSAKELRTASDFYGVWEDTDYSSDGIDLVQEIKQVRNFKNAIEAF